MAMAYRIFEHTRSNAQRQTKEMNVIHSFFVGLELKQKELIKSAKNDSFGERTSEQVKTQCS